MGSKKYKIWLQVTLWAEKKKMVREKEKKRKEKSHLMGTQAAVRADLAGASIVQLQIIVTF